MRFATCIFVTSLLGMSLCLIAASPANAPNGQKDRLNSDLISAVKAGDLAGAARLLNEGADPNTRDTLISKPSLSDRLAGGKPYPGDTALMIAVDRESDKLVKLLVSKGANVNAAGQAGFTPLIGSANRNNLPIARYLLAHGAKVDQRNEFGDTAIVFAANLGHEEMVELLLKKGANINGGTGWSPLMMASYNYGEPMVRLLIRKGADVNYHPRGLMSPLECAIAQRNDGIAAILREAGATGPSVAQAQSQQEQRLAKWKSEQKAAASAILKPAGLTGEDRSLLNAALADMLAYKGKELRRDNESSADIGLVNKTFQWSRYGDNQLNADLDTQKALDVSLDIREDLIRRNPTPASLAAFKPTVEHVLMMNEEDRVSEWAAPRSNAPKVRAWIEVTLPGYSKQRDRAVLRFWFGPTAHGASGTYFLIKQDGIWKVKWRHFAFYA